jgi:hypothetical protein
MRVRLPFAIAVLVLAGIFPACGEDSPSVEAGDTVDSMIDATDATDTVDSRDPLVEEVTSDLLEEPMAPLLGNIQLIENPANVLSYFVEWNTFRLADTRLDVECGDEVTTTIDAADMVTAHSVFLMGLIEGLHCELTVRATDEDDRSESRSVDLDVTDELPDFLPPFRSSSTIPSECSPDGRCSIRSGSTTRATSVWS